MITGIDVPLEIAAALVLAALAAGLWTGRRQTIRRLVPRRDPIAELLQPAALVEAIDLTACRNAERAGSQAVLSGRIDQLAGLRNVWNPGIREQVQDHVAAVMRAGLRRGDHLTHIDGEGFTIIIPGADERAGVRIANRLRRSLAQLRFSNHAGAARVAASFGVAAGRCDASGDHLIRQARRALDAALAKGHDHIVAASEYQEVLYLPAPEARTAAAA